MSEQDNEQIPADAAAAGTQRWRGTFVSDTRSFEGDPIAQLRDGGFPRMMVFLDGQDAAAIYTQEPEYLERLAAAALAGAAELRDALARRAAGEQR